MTAAQAQRLKALLRVENDFQLMNELQDKGLVSDLCVTVDDVAHCDADRAISLHREQELWDDVFCGKRK